jgi:hypothetical protein
MKDVEKAQKIDDFSSHLKVIQIDNQFLIRVGNVGDGGYVMYSKFSGKEILISAGIGNDVSWDFHMLDHFGAEAVVQIDHTIGGKPPIADPRVIFVDKMLENYDSKDSVTLRWLLDRLPKSRAKILKIDIEGSEWKVFAGCTLSDLNNFDQICVEFHNLHQVIFSNEPDFLETMVKLARNHVPIHVHANNWGAYEIIANRPVPDVLEVTYLNKRFLDELDQKKTPANLDSPNHPERPDIKLSFN